ncbi:MAG: hypothetical protein CVV49_07350 [Spirochaetae bacterium HGW-Spirochaetae-5]|nr:MAG: hypothetical protein CVV49_07350 [Spirochaetae bacterium HGW-Spirochaetae-5]
MGGGRDMLLRIAAALLLLTIPFYVHGSLITSDRYQQIDAEKDIEILKSIISRNPDDLINIKRLIDLTYTLEKFDQTEKYCAMYLSAKKNSEIAYLKIIAAASSGKFSSASEQIGTFIDEYKRELSSRDISLLLYKQSLYKKSSFTRGYPSGAKLTSWGTDSQISWYIPVNNIFSLYNPSGSNRKLFNHGSDSAGEALNFPDFLSGLSVESVNFISLSSDGREILAGSGDNKSSKIYTRAYIPEKRKWSSWDSPAELNPGRLNHSPNFIDDNTVIFSSSDGADFDLYISERDSSGRWSRAYKPANINTPLDEISAWVHPDGKTLYFSTNGREGMGGFDIYGARLLKKDNLYEASDIKNIESVNTFRNEKFPLFVSPSGTEAFFNFREGNKFSIYSSTAFYKPEPVFFYNAGITDDLNGNPVSGAAAEFRTSDSADLIKRPVYSDGFTGAILRRNRKYTLTVTAEGYEPVSKTLSFTGGSADKNLLSEKIRLKKKPEKQRVTGYTTLITSLKLIDCEESISLPTKETLEQRIGVQPDGINYGRNISSYTVCGDIRCAIPDGKTVKADFVVFGTLRKTKQTAMKTLGDKGEDQYLARRVSETVYILELNLIDTASERILLTFKRTTVNPDSLKNLAVEFAKKTEKFYTQGNR